VYLAESNHAPFGRLEAPAVLKTILMEPESSKRSVPLKTLVLGGSRAARAPSARFLIVTEMNDSSQVVLRQTSASDGR
jgi:hypothetical protein